TRTSRSSASSSPTGVSAVSRSAAATAPGTPPRSTMSAELRGAHVARLLISCPDRPGIVAAVSRFLFEHGANVLDADQHSTDPVGGTFFMRMEFHLDGLDLGRGELEQAFAAQVAEPFAMEWSIAYAADRKRVAILVSREDHCLLDLLWRWRSGELDAD